METCFLEFLIVPSPQISEVSQVGLEFSRLVEHILIHPDVWLVNLTPLTYPPEKQGFNKALLRETNGVG